MNYINIERISNKKPCKFKLTIHLDTGNLSKNIMHKLICGKYIVIDAEIRNYKTLTTTYVSVFGDKKKRIYLYLSRTRPRKIFHEEINIHIGRNEQDFVLKEIEEIKNYFNIERELI